SGEINRHHLLSQRLLTLRGAENGDLGETEFFANEAQRILIPEMGRRPTCTEARSAHASMLDSWINLGDSVPLWPNPPLLRFSLNRSSVASVPPMSKWHGWLNGPRNS